MGQERGSTHAKRAAYELRQRIVKGVLPGGTRLYEVALAEELDISRTPVREAMSRLAEEGLLERARGGGFVVRSFTREDMVDAIELRGVLEGTAFRLAAEAGITEAQSDKIFALVDQIDGTFAPNGESDLELYSELNALFHEEMMALCPSSIVRSELERVKALPFASPSAFVFKMRDPNMVMRSLFMAQNQHRAMIDAVTRRQGMRAEALAREHARIARSNLEAKTDDGSGLPAMAVISS